MANYNTLKTAIQNVIKTNGNNEITGAILQSSLISLIDSLGAGYQYIGVANPLTNPGTPDQKVFYFSSSYGNYTNFGLTVENGEFAVLYYDTQWHKGVLNVCTVEMLGKYWNTETGASAFSTNGFFPTTATTESNYNTNATFKSVWKTVVGGETFKFHVYTGSNLMTLAAIDSSGNIIDSQVIAGSGWKDGQYKVPASATKLVITTQGTYVADSYVSELKDISALIAEIMNDVVLTTAQTLTDASKVQARANIDAAKFGDFSYKRKFQGIDAFPLRGFFGTSATTESQFTNNNSFISVKIPVTPGQIINYYIRSQTNVKMIAAIDATGNIIDTVIAPSSSEYSSGTYTVPANAVSVYITGNNNASYTPNDYYELSFNLLDDIAKCVQVVEQSFNDAQKTIARNNIGAISEADAGYFWEKISGADAFQINGFYSTAGVWSSNATFKSARISVQEGDKIRYNLNPNSTIWGVVALASDGTTIVDHLQITGTNVTGTYTVPANAKYVILTTYNTYVAISDYSIRISIADFYNKAKELFGSTPLIVRQTDTQSGEFTTVGAALALANEGDTIHIYPGTYNESHLILPRGIKLIGKGDKADIIISGDLGATVPVATNREYSTIEAYYGCTMENLTVTAKNMRYPVHQDAGDGNNRWYIRNCHFIHYGNQEAYNYQVSLGSSGQPGQIWNANSAWGGGMHGGDYVECVDCIFESVGRGFSEHDNNDASYTNYGSSMIRLVNCDMISRGIDKDGTLSGMLASLFVQSYPSAKHNQIILSNCRLNGYVVATDLSSLELKMYGCGKQRLAWSFYGSNGNPIYGSQYDIARNKVATPYYPKNDETNYFVNRGTDAIPFGAPVKALNGGVALANTGDELFGIAMDAIAVGEIGNCVTGGFVSRVYPLGIRDNTYWVGTSPDYAILKNIGDPIYLGNGRFTFTETGAVVMRVADNQNIVFEK